MESTGNISFLCALSNDVLLTYPSSEVAFCDVLYKCIIDIYIYIYILEFVSVILRCVVDVLQFGGVTLRCGFDDLLQTIPVLLEI